MCGVSVGCVGGHSTAWIHVLHEGSGAWGTFSSAGSLAPTADTYVYPACILCHTHVHTNTHTPHTGLLRTLRVGAGGAAASAGGDITRGDGALEPTVPGAAVELLSRLIVGAAWAPAAGGAAGGGAAAAESKKAAAARAAAADGLAPLLPGLTALAAVSSCGRQYSDWLVLALESAALSGSAPDKPDQLVLRSASNVVACLCGNDSCFALWEAKHKGGLRGSARVLAALVQQPQLLGPLLQQRTSVEAFRGLLAALPARHRSHLAAGKQLSWFWRQRSLPRKGVGRGCCW